MQRVSMHITNLQRNIISNCYIQYDDSKKYYIGIKEAYRQYLSYSE